MDSTICSWAKSELEIDYHNKEWGKPLHKDDLLFEFLILEGMQAGLSWSTILNKRESMRTAFDDFNPNIIKDYDQDKINELMQNDKIIRNLLKLNAMVTNAKTFLEVQKEYGSFDQYIWKFSDYKQIQNKWENTADIPAYDGLSQIMSKELKKRGFKFVGPTICYAFMQAIGIVNDHIVTCPQYHNCTDSRN